MYTCMSTAADSCLLTSLDQAASMVDQSWQVSQQQTSRHISSVPHYATVVFKRPTTHLQEGRGRRKLGQHLVQQFKHVTIRVCICVA